MWKPGGRFSHMVTAPSFEGLVFEMVCLQRLKRVDPDFFPGLLLLMAWFRKWSIRWILETGTDRQTRNLANQTLQLCIHKSSGLGVATLMTTWNATGPWVTSRTHHGFQHMSGRGGLGWPGHYPWPSEMASKLVGWLLQKSSWVSIQDWLIDLFAFGSCFKNRFGWGTIASQ